MFKTANVIDISDVEKKFRNFHFILYPEWGDLYDDIIMLVRSSYKKYAYIVHEPELETKKVHCHLILSVDSPRSVNSICSHLNVPVNLCEPVRSIRGICRYITHIDEEDKITYSLNDVKVSGAFTSTFLKAYDDLKSDDEILQDIYDLVEQMKELSPIECEMELSKICCQQNYSSIFKRYYNTICKVISFKCKKS